MSPELEPGGRGPIRSLRRAATDGLFLSGQRVAGIAVGLVTVPLAARTLSSEGFGVWLLLSTLTAVLGALDFGLANGLVTHVARATASETAAEVRALASAAWFALGMLALAMACGLVALIVLVDLRGGLGVATSISAGEVKWSLAVLAVSVSLALPLSVASRVYQGRHELKVVATWGIVGVGAQLVVSVVCFAAEASLPWWTLAAMCGPVVAGVGTSISLFIVRHPELRPRRRDIRRKSVTNLARSGWLFFVLGIAFAVGFQTDALVISARLGAEQVAEYVVPYRLFMLAPSFAGLLVLPLWAGYADALHRGDDRWVRRAFRTSLTISGAVTVFAGLVLIVAGPFIIRVWVGPSVPEPSRGLLAILALLALVMAVSTTIAMLLNGADVIGLQVVVATVMVTANLALSLALVGPLGVSGPPLATVIAQTFSALVPYAFFLRRFLRQMRPPPTPALGAPLVSAQ